MATDVDGSKEDPLGDCPICFEKLREEDMGNPDAPKRPMRTHCLPKRHIFCKECLDKAFEEVGTCPMCRFGEEFLDLEDEEWYNEMMGLMKNVFPPEKVQNVEHARAFARAAATYTAALTRPLQLPSKEGISVVKQSLEKPVWLVKQLAMGVL